MKKTNGKKELIIKKYLTFVNKNTKLPSITELKKFGINRGSIREHFGNHTSLHLYMRKHHKKELESIVDETLFTPKRFKHVKKVAKASDRFVITTAVVEKQVHTKFMESLKSYCKRNKAMLLVLPCADVASRSRTMKWTLDSSLKDEHIIFNDLSLNSKLFVSSIKLSAKHINPLTGLSRISQRNGSFIYASPKQYLEFVPSIDSLSHGPRAFMTTGAVTLGDYSTDKYMSERTSYIAEHDHVLGAIVVEVKNSKEFYFRQVQADEKTGSFIDLGKKYEANGKVKKIAPEAFILGDFHCTETDQEIKTIWKDVVKTTGVQSLILHDFFSGVAVNHHELDKPLKRAKQYLEDTISLEKEIHEVCYELNDLVKWVPGSVVIVKSNHDEFLNRYLIEGKYVKDPVNHYYSLELAKALLDDKDPLKYAVEQKGVRNPDKVVWLKRDEEYKIANVECGAHGDLGSNGKRAPGLLGLEKAYGNCVIGHSHTAAIIRGVFRVGTSSKLRLNYNVGPSSWTHTSCLLYPNGSRQLINVINGEWRLEK